MNKFIRNIALFVLYIVILSAVFAALYKYKTGVTFKDLPAPNITNSFSYNDKMSFIRNKRANVVTVGSSMSLNNLDSKTIINNLKTDSYLNLSSWGLNMKDIFCFIKVYAAIHKPSTIIISSNYQDFQSSDKKVDYMELRNYLTDTTSTWRYYVTNFNVNYYYTNFMYHKLVKSSNSYYESLCYDKYGAVLLNTSNFKINKQRWSHLDYSDLTENSYCYLDSISGYCRQNSVKLFFFQCPIRSGIYVNLDKKAIIKHIKRVEKIILRDGNVFVDPNDRLWADSLYVDALHFNSEGAKEFTEYCFNKYKKLGLRISN